MDFTAPVSRFMTRKLVTAVPEDRLTVIKEIFDTQRIHHIPVVKFTTLVGIISKMDFIHFTKGHEFSPYDEMTQKSLLEKHTAGDIMTKGIATLASDERLNVALQVLAENLFHAIPIVDDGQLVGMLTTLDIIKVLVEEDNARIKAV
jgi:acetoin utilization protein AcuB